MAHAGSGTTQADESTPWGSGARVPLGEVCGAFARIGMLGFGGVAPITRHELVERRRWLSEQEYAAMLGLGKILPGANTVNAAVMIGDRFCGPRGAVLAVAALMAAPVVVAVALTLVYQHFAGSPLAQAMMAGAAAAAAGLVIGTAAKMARGVQRSTLGLIFGLTALVTVGFFKVSLILAVAVLGPLAILAAWAARRRR